MAKRFVAWLLVSVTFSAAGVEVSFDWDVAVEKDDPVLRERFVPRGLDVSRDRAWRDYAEALGRRGKQISAQSSDAAVRVVAAADLDGGVAIVANVSDREVPISLNLGGRDLWCCRVSDAKWADYYHREFPDALSPHSFAVLYLDWARPRWERPKTTRRYLQGPCSERLLVAWREGKLTFGEVVHTHDWKKTPYESQVAHGVWMLHGENDEAFDFRKAVLKVENGGVPIHGQVWRTNNVEYAIESCALMGRRPNAHLRISVSNTGTEAFRDRLAIMLRTGREKELVAGAPDGYDSYAPKTDDWKAVVPTWAANGDGLFRDGERFVAFPQGTDIRWDATNGIVRIDLRIKPHETKTLDCVIGKGLVERPHYDAVRERVKADWHRELARVEWRPEIVKQLLVQILQCFSMPTEGEFVLPRQGGLQRWVWPGDQKHASAALDLLGYGEYVEKAVDFYFGQYQKDDGEVGPFGNNWANDTGSVLDIFSRHALESGDGVFWTRYRESAIRAFRWIMSRRDADGLFPALKSSDAKDVFKNWGGTDVSNLMAIERFAAAAERFNDAITSEACAAAVEYRSSIARPFERWRRASEGKDSFFIPFAPDGEGEAKRRSSDFFYSHPGNFASAGFLDGSELLRVRTWLEREKVADAESGLYERCPCILPHMGRHVWYLTWSEFQWFCAWRRVGRYDLARKALDVCLKYSMSEEYAVGERYHDLDPWFFPWSPNASGAGRILQMLLLDDIADAAPDPRVRTYVMPTRIVWQTGDNGDAYLGRCVVSGAQSLLKQKFGQVPESGWGRKSDGISCVLQNSGNVPSLILDFGRELHGGLQFAVKSESTRGCRVRVRLGESVSETMSDAMFAEKGAGNDHALRDFVLDLPVMGTRETGNSGFRFVRIDLLTTGKLSLDSVRAVSLMRPMKQVGFFRSSDRRLNEIFDTAVRTVHLCCQDYLWDGIKRDRLVWLGDMHPETMAVLNVFGADAVLSDTLEYAMSTTPSSSWMNTFPTYTLCFLRNFAEWYRFTGDRAYLERHAAYLERTFDTVIANIGENGWKVTSEYGAFLDWPTHHNVDAERAGAQALALLAAKEMVFLGRELGSRRLVGKAESAIGRLQALSPDPHGAKSAAALLALSGMRSPRDMFEQVLWKNNHKGVSTFYGYYMLEAMSVAKEKQRAIDTIRDYWGGMLDVGATSFWENFDLAWTNGCFRIDEFPVAGKKDVHGDYGEFCYPGFRHSLCHGWSSGPAAWLINNVLGIRIVGVGCRKVEVRPFLGNLDWAEGAMALPDGNAVKVRVDKQGSDGKLKLSVDAPPWVEVIRD